MASRNSERAVYHVTPDASAERWIVSLENSNFRQEFETKSAAENRIASKLLFFLNSFSPVIYIRRYYTFI